MSAASSTHNSKKSNTWLLAIFGLPFLACGLFTGVTLTQNIMTVLKVRNWPVVDARILDAKLSAYQSGSHSRHSHRSTTYAVQVRYEYMWQGRRYEGTRVGVESGSDNIGRAHFDRLAILREHLDTNIRMPCRVDPSNPSNAVLFPELRPELAVFFALFAVIFSGAGLGLIISAVVKILQEKSARKRLANHPGQPWLARKEWSTSSIPSEEQQYKQWVFTGFAVFWNLIAWAFFFLLSKERQITFTSPPMLIIFLFILIGLAVAWAAVLEHFRYFRFGKVRFDLSSGPGRIGGEITGNVQIPAQIETSVAVEVQLTCQRIRDAKSRRNDIRSTEEALSVLKDMPKNKCYPNEMVWSVDAQQPMIQSQGDMGVLIPVRFEIPENLPPSTIEQCGDGDIAWKLYVRVKMNGPDLVATFEMPVLGS